MNNQPTMEKWNPAEYINSIINLVRSEVKDGNVVCSVRGDLNSTITATIMHQACGKKVKFVFVDTGLMRQDEVAHVLNLLRQELGLNVWHSDAREFFFSRLRKAYTNDDKIIAINKTYIDSLCFSTDNMGFRFNFFADSFGIEDQSPISEECRNDLLNKMNVTIINPLRNLSDEQIEAIADFLDIPRLSENVCSSSIQGLADSIGGMVTRSKVDVVRKADCILTSELKLLDNKSDNKINSSVALLDIECKQPADANEDNERKYVLVLKVLSCNSDGQLRFPLLPKNFWTNVSSKITDRISEVSKVFVDFTTTL